MILSFWTDRPSQTVFSLISICTFWTIFILERPPGLNFRVMTAKGADGNCGADWRSGKAEDFGPRGPRF